MYRKNFGKLIIALRREHLENQTKPWTRQKFAQESGIDQEILANIESGRRTILYPDLLLKLADALKLTSGERKEFFLAASGIDEQNIYHRLDTPKTALEEMLATMEQLQQPAFLVDQFFDIVAINPMVLEVYNVSMNQFLNPSSDPLTRCNLIRFFFSSEFNEQKAMLGRFREKFATNTAMLFRAATLRYRATEYFQRLCPRLYEFDDFKIHFQREPKDEHYADNNMFITLNNPRLGLIRSIGTSVSATTTAGELKLFILTPLNEDTARVFGKIAQQGNYVFQALPDWPDKGALAEKMK